MTSVGKGKSPLKREFCNNVPQRTIPEGSWLSRMLARKPRMLVAIALANKMARQIWAMLTKNKDYRDPAMAVVA